MMAVAENPQVERLRRMIEIAERKGEEKEPRTQRLREELAEALGAECHEPEEDWDDDEASPLDQVDPSLVTSLPFAERIKRRLQEHGVFELGDLSPWTYRLLSSITGITPLDAQAIRDRLAAMNCGGIVGSAPKLLTVLPPKSSLAIDMRQGVTREDLEAIGRRVFRRELTQRSASEAMGSPEGRGWHQRWPSSFDRNSAILSPIAIEEMTREYRQAPWFVGAELVEIPNARKRRWGARVIVRCTEDEARAALDLKDFAESKGRGDADGSWLGLSVILEVRT